MAIAALTAGRSEIQGIVPAWMERVTGALALGVAALPVVAEVRGSMLLGLGLARFLRWLGFLVAAAISFVRTPRGGL